MIGTLLRVKLVVLRETAFALDRSKQIVLLMCAVFFGQYTFDDPLAWIAPLRPLLIAPVLEPVDLLPCLVVAMAIVALGALARPAFALSSHSRYLASVGIARRITVVADATLVALLIAPFALVMIAGLAHAKIAFVDWATLALFLALLATWLRLAAASLSTASVSLAASAGLVWLIASHVIGMTIVASCALATLLVALVTRARRRWHGIRKLSWPTGSARANLWIALLASATRDRSPWLFAPTIALFVVVAVTARERSARDDAVLLVAGALLFWQLVSAAKVAELAMHTWRSSRVLMQLPVGTSDRMLRIALASAMLLTIATPAEALSLNVSGNAWTPALTTLVLCAPWMVGWAQARHLLRGLAVWVAAGLVAWASVAY